MVNIFIEIIEAEAEIKLAVVFATNNTENLNILISCFTIRIRLFSMILEICC